MWVRCAMYNSNRKKLAPTKKGSRNLPRPRLRPCPSGRLFLAAGHSEARPRRCAFGSVSAPARVPTATLAPILKPTRRH